MSIINFPFQKKEGKFFAPIVSEETTYKVSNGAVVADATKLVGGVKGAYAIAKLVLPAASAGTKTELFSAGSLAVYSSS